MKRGKKNNFFQMKASDDGKSADIFIYGEITKWAWEEYGEVSSVTFKKELDELGDDIELINLYINSPGGSVFEGVTIYNMLKRHKAKIITYIDGVAASIASVVAMAGDTIKMPKNAMMMIHNAWTFIWGDANELRKVADDLDRITQASATTYLEKSGSKLTEDKLKEMLDAETWLSADEAYEYGLCDEVLEANEMAASISKEFLSRYKNVPEHLFQQKNNVISAEEMALRQKIAGEAKANSAYLKTILGGI